jgi:sugar (pentulose or hexulose) kinase
LALKYRQVVESLEKVTGRKFDSLHAGGGGIQNELLIQSTANALGIPVVAGPIEATSCGNIITQMVATGEIENITEGRKIVEKSMKTQTFIPTDAAEWKSAYEQFLKLQ